LASWRSSPTTQKSPFIYKIGLGSDQKRDLLAFLKALSDPDGSPKKP